MKARVLDALGEVFASPLLFDEGVEAARNACVAGAPISAALVTAAIYYDNPLNGAPAVLGCMERISAAELTLAGWIRALRPAPHPITNDPDHSPGFGHIGRAQHRALIDAAATLAQHFQAAHLGFFLRQRGLLEAALGPLNGAGLCALIFIDQHFTREASERAFLSLRVEPALVAAQKARADGLKRFPFFESRYAYEGSWPAARSSAEDAALDLHALATEVGLAL